MQPSCPDPASPMLSAGFLPLVIDSSRPGDGTRSNQSGLICLTSQSGASWARSSRTARSVSPTHSRLESERTRASTWVDSVRCFPPSLPPAPLLAPLQKPIQQQRLRPLIHQTQASFGQQREVKAGIGQFSSQAVFPINARTLRISGLSICQTLGILQHGDHR